MPSFASYDATVLGYRVLGDGPPLVCLPGGPGRSVDYLGDLGGLAKSRQLILLDPRGVGQSADPVDPATLRVDRLVDDVEALRVHLHLGHLDLLAHSAGAVLALLYATTHPARLDHLLLITPGLAPLGIFATEEELTAALTRHANEPWYADALGAVTQIMSGDMSIEAFDASRPFYYARWDVTSQQHATVGLTERQLAARRGYFADITFDQAETRDAFARLSAPVLLYAGDVDPAVAPRQVNEAAPLFADATVVIQSGASHFPWVDDPGAFADAVNAYLSAR